MSVLGCRRQDDSPCDYLPETVSVNAAGHLNHRGADEARSNLSNDQIHFDEVIKNGMTPTFHILRYTEARYARTCERFVRRKHRQSDKPTQAKHLGGEGSEEHRFGLTS